MKDAPAMPKELVRFGATVISLRTADDETLKGWWIPLGKPESETVILFPGTDFNRRGYHNDILWIREYLKCNILIMDHRGIGGSSGKPETSKLLADTTRIFDAVAFGHQGIEQTPPHKIHVMGGSFGGALAIHLATQRKFKTLIPYSTFHSFWYMRMKRGIPFWNRLLLRAVAWLTSDELESMRKLPFLKQNIQGVFLVHGLGDERIDTTSMMKLFVTAKTCAIPVDGFGVITGLHENALNQIGPEYGAKIRHFMDHPQTAPEPEIRPWRQRKSTPP